ncbi:uncharacterized protein MONBRDRAFT_24617 [Monosiga brevicollis MX1]|uniref:FACT complex subunit n=1 Tax=Monosiga brevicollis TaxID=81824 RepID=A9UWZ2_MONBE|nr:uncharacterized protein MONBRDRAFT_24617 [Monosiga brevicollis MX1]EDQ90301.1 predicted protein [Monosiga brevicollis MX1]|eukprot:XP_001745068.1 hypothetical protein [Monosiga brevicollis MX1]
MRPSGQKRVVLRDMSIRPVTRKRNQGTLEMHANGLRYTSKSEPIDILFSNIRNAFYQPCKNEVVIALHFHLKNPILIDKKLVKDVQFYREVGEVQTDLAQVRGRGEREEAEREQTERRLKKKFHQEFENFYRTIEEELGQRIMFEVPYEKLAFPGPAFVLVLADVERVHFERVSFRTRNFDIVFIFKDYKRPVHHVGAIPNKHLEMIKQWLDSCEFRYTQGPLTLQWKMIMKEITTKPQEFLDNGGWSFLDEDDPDQSGEDSEDQESEFEVSEDELDEAEESTEEEFDDSELELGDEESEEEYEEDSDEEGEDWDDLEEQARADDDEEEFAVVSAEYRHMGEEFL